MDLLQNPFYVLNATLRDNRRRIVELAEERSLLRNADECSHSRLDLTNPRKRLSAEVSWLLGVGPKRTAELINLLDKSVTELISVDKITPIAKANLLASGITHLPDKISTIEIGNYIMELALAFERVDPEDVYLLINEERVVSGFPEVNDITAIEEEISERRHYCRKAIKIALDKLQSRDLIEVITIAIEAATNDGEEQGLILIDDIVDDYEVEAQVFLEKEAENIETLIETIKQSVDSKKPDSILERMISNLIQVVRNWDIVAQPIQVSVKSRGLDHNASHNVALSVRGLAIHLFNEHGKLEFSQKLTNLLQETFAEVTEISERIEEDADALEDIAEERVRLLDDTKKRSEEWRREITYQAEIGHIFKDRLKISPDGIEWKGQNWPLDFIFRTRWGATKHYVNGIPSGTHYNIFIGNSRDHLSIDLKKEEVFNQFVDRLWKAVGVRILTDLLKGLRGGKKYKFGSAIIYDHGIELEKAKWIGNNERVFCLWSELVIWNEPGAFCIGKKNEKKLAVTLSYQEDDNVHILEAAIRTFWKQAADKISDLLEG
jgi:hypothetical protein